MNMTDEERDYFDRWVRVEIYARWIKNGVAALQAGTDRDGNPATIDPAAFTIRLAPDSTDHRYLFSELSVDKTRVELNAAINVTLPVYFPEATRLSPDFAISIPDLAAFFRDDNGSYSITTPDFSGRSGPLKVWPT